MAHSKDDLPQLISESVQDAGLTVALAESLTCGNLTSVLGRGENTSDWLRGGVVAYSAEVKQQVLGVTPGPTVSALCAEEMASGVAELLNADIAVSTTGVGGPGTSEGEPAGTVYIGWCNRGEVGSTRYTFAGDPDSVLNQASSAALQRLYDIVTETD